MPEDGRVEEAELEALGWRSALVKACFDYFDSAVGLVDGTVIAFQHATPSQNRQWVHLKEPQVLFGGGGMGGARGTANPMTFDRGLDVRVSAIVWAADGPWGS